ELPLLPGASLPYPHPPGRVAADPSVAAPAPGHHSPAPRPVVTRRNRNWPPDEALRQQARKREHAHLHGIGIATAAQTVGLFIQEALISSDYVFDAALKRHGQVTITRTVDWYNTSYMMSCGGLAPQPFTVNVQGGKATAPGSSGGYSTYQVHVEAVTQPGALTSDGSPQTAVLLYCSPQPSNFFVEEVQVFKSDGGLLGELPPTGTLSPGSSLPPQYDSSQFSISTGQLITGMKFYAPTDSHASGPSIHQVLKWSWDGHQFIHDPFTLPQ